MSVSEESAAPGWLVILPADVAPDELERLRAAAGARGWLADASRGEEQAVLALEGPRARGELDGLLAGREADVLPVLSSEHYRRLRLRRRSLALLVAALALAIAGGTLLPLASFLRPPPGAIVAPGVVRVGDVDALAVGQARRTRFQDRPVLVIRVAPHGWRAVLAECSFLARCQLEWDAERQRAVCPCHGCEYDAQGNVAHSPASAPLVRLETLEQDGAVLVRSAL